MQINQLLTILDKPGDRPIALQRAMEVGALTGADLRFAAFTWHSVSELSQIFSTSEREDIEQAFVASRESEARCTLADAGMDGADLQTIWCRDIAQWLAAELERAPADLVVKGVRASHMPWHTPLDWALLRQCPAPLLLTRDAAPWRRGRLLAAVDLMAEDAEHRARNHQVLTAARRLAALQNGTVQMVSVIPMSKVIHDLEIIDEHAMAGRVREQTASYLESLCAEFDIPPQDVHRPVGKVGPMVAAVARRQNADLVVIGRGPHALRRAVGLAGTPEQIARHASGDLLAIAT